MAVLSAWAQKGIVSHCFPVNAGRVRSGSTLGEERRGQGQKQRPAELCQTWLWLLTDPGQEGRDRPLASPLLPSSLTHSSGSRDVQELGPCLSISLSNFSRTKASPCFSGERDTPDIRFLPYSFTDLSCYSFYCSELEVTPRRGTAYCWFGIHLSQQCYLSVTCYLHVTALSWGHL